MQADHANSKIRLFLGSFAALYGIGYLSYILSPVVIGSIVQGLGLDEAEAGIVATVELFTLALCIFALAPRMAALPRRKLAFIGVALVIIGHGSSALAASFLFLLPARAVAGVGLGMLIATGNAVVAGSGTPQRLFASAFAVGQLQAAALLLFVFPAIAERWSYHGTYGFLALWALVMAPLLWFLPTSPPDSHQEAQSSPATAGLFLLPSVLAMALIGASDASVWTFTERIAAGLGLSAPQAGSVLAGALIAGVIGSTLAGLLGTKLGERWPILIGSVLLATAYFCVTNATNGVVYSVAQVSVLGSYGFIIPYLFGVNGRMDRQGRVMVAGSGAHLIGTGAGPLLAGQAIIAVGYPGVGTLVFVMTIGCAVLFLIAIRSGTAKPATQTSQ